MIPSAIQAQITSQILKRVFGTDISPDQVKRLEVHQTESAETVVIVTPFALYTVGRDYFRQLVTELKPTIQEENRGSGRITTTAAAPTKPTRQIQEATCLQNNGTTSIWQVIGETGNLYLVSHNIVSGKTKCGCKAASFGRTCYHATTVKQVAAVQECKSDVVIAPTRYRSPAERGIPSLRLEQRASEEEIREENEKALKRGALALSDGTVAVNDRFYQLMGSVSQVRGAAMRELNKKRRNALFA
jgi:hypothetical protein